MSGQQPVEMLVNLSMLRRHSPKAQGCKYVLKTIQTVMLVFIGQLSLSSLRRVPICQGSSHFSAFLHHFVLAKLATTSIRVKLPVTYYYGMIYPKNDLGRGGGVVGARGDSWFFKGSAFCLM